MIGDKIMDEIIQKIKECSAWSLIVDSTPDISHKEQLSICVRVVSSVVTEHLLFCKRAGSTTASGLFDSIIDAFNTKNASFQNLVAQTYDGASNMSGSSGGLQTIVKDKIGKHVIYTHCLNLVLKDSVDIQTTNVVKLFDDLGSLYNLFNRSIKIHKLFEDVQSEANLKKISIKRLNTVRWSSRELCLHVFLKRYDSIVKVLDLVGKDTSLEDNQRSVSTGLMKSFQRKEIVATACLFRQIFSIAGR